MKKSDVIEQMKILVLEIGKHYNSNCIKMEINCNTIKEIVKINITEYIDK
jgi:hypothetical protein